MPKTLFNLFVLLCLAGLSSAVSAAGPNPEPLWKGAAPGAQGTEAADVPQIRVYRPRGDVKPNGAGVVVCPGGGYAVLATDHEGHQVAKWLNTFGVTAFVLKYRLGPRYRHPVPLQDAQRAIRTMRHRAGELNLDPGRIGIMGFSAGGHLASTVATHFDSGRKSGDEIDQQGCRPDFVILGYPVVSLIAPYSHKGSGKRLLGDNPDKSLLESLSNDTQVTAETPPAFLFHTAGDEGVSVENSLSFFTALRKHKVPAELHVYQDGPHGVGLGNGSPPLESWKRRLADWLRASAFLTSRPRATVTGKITFRKQPLRWGTIAFVPEDPNAPVGWGMVNRGNFSIPTTSGPVTGKHRVEIRNMGGVEPEPTIEAVSEITRGALVAMVSEKNNVFEFNLE